MMAGQRQFLEELDKEIGNHPHKTEILAEYEQHSFELLEDLNCGEDDCYEQLTARIGDPEELAALWKQEKVLTPARTQYLFVFSNIALFLGGILLTVSYNLFEWSWIGVLWGGLTEATTIIILAYIVFWALLGYEIGREFGHNGGRLLNRTFIFSVVPNLLLMYLVIFKIIPYEWFQPLLSVPFILFCVFCTGLLYPISLLGYRWGRKASV